MLKQGSAAPDFTLPSTSGSDFQLSVNGAGQPVVVFFYPKDFTPGCTAEVCGFRDQFEEFRHLNVQVVGISRDSIATHKKFKEKYGLPFELLSDKNGNVSKLYDAIIPYINLNKRITYLIDAEGTIQTAISSQFGIKKHIEKMLGEAGA